MFILRFDNQDLYLPKTFVFVDDKTKICDITQSKSINKRLGFRM